MMSVTLERLWMVSDRIVDFRFFVKFHRSGPAIIFNSWTIVEHVSCPSKKILIKPRFIRTSSRWWVLLWKDYGWLLIELSIFDFSSNFTGSDLQQFLNHHGASELSIKKAPNQAKIYQDLIKMVSITLERLWMASERFSIFRQISQVRTCNNFRFLNHHGACELSIKKAPISSQDLSGPHQDGECYSGKIMVGFW